MNTDDQRYVALVARDRRFDGRFFVGVTSTGIYCRPICPARTPGRARCRFFGLAAQAEGAGFRPCLRCRPELAPGCAAVDAGSRLATAALTRIEAGDLDDGGVDGVASELGVTARHLRRTLVRELGVTPIAIAQTRRLLLAKQLLCDTTLGAADIAFAAGFGSVRRFNALFHERYGLRPTALRRAGARAAQGGLTLRLAFRSPLDWPGLLSFLAARTLTGVEVVDVQAGSYARTVELGGHRGFVVVRADDEDGGRANERPTSRHRAGLVAHSSRPGPAAPGRHVLRAELSLSLLPVLQPLLARLRALFDLDADPATIAEHLGDTVSASAVLSGTTVPLREGLRVPGAFDGFELGVRTILGQVVTVKAATTMAGRVAQRCGEAFQTPIPGLTHLTPTPHGILRAGPEALAALGILPARARALCALAQAMSGGGLQLGPGCDLAATHERLCALPGVGEWTARYIAMRALRDGDAFPTGDLVLHKLLGVPGKRALDALSRRWSPWRAYAVLQLWTHSAAFKEAPNVVSKSAKSPREIAAQALSQGPVEQKRRRR